MKENKEDNALREKINSPEQFMQFQDIINKCDEIRHKEYVIKFSSQSDIRSWQPALDEFEEHLLNYNYGKITGDIYVSSSILHKSFIAVDETSVIQLLFNLGKKYNTTGRIKIVRIDGEIQTVIFNRSTKAYR